MFSARSHKGVALVQPINATRQTGWFDLMDFVVVCSRTMLVKPILIVLQ